MEHTRALYLINKSELKESDKAFLKTHLEHIEATINSLKTEILQLRDIIEYNRALDNKILTFKEEISKLSQLDDDITKKLDYIMKEIKK